MKKSKRWLAVLLAAWMMVTPAAEVYAANSTTVSVSDNELIVEVSETEETTETTETVEESVEEVIETEEATEEVSGEIVEETTEVVSEESGEAVGSTEESDIEETTEEITTEEVTTEEATTEEVTTEEIMTEEATTEEVTTEEITTEEETTEEATTEEVTTEVSTEEVDEHNWNGSGHKAPKLEMELSSAMVAEKHEIQGTVKRLTNLTEGVQYAANEAVFMADSKSYAKEVAEGYGASLDSYESGVAIMSFEEDVTEIIAMAEDMDVMLPAVYPNYIYTSCDDMIMGYAPTAEDVEMGISNDAGIAYQTHHTDIKSAAAWAYNDAAGKGIKVAVIDSGIDKNHYDLNGKSTASVTYATPYNKGADNNGHGTHVSGIIAAKKDNRAYGAGVAYNASILSIKAMEHDPFTDRCGGDTAAIIKAVNSATKNGARVINMSLGGAYYDALFEAAVDNAVNKGVVVVAAAGNDGKTMSTTTSSAVYYSPACFENVITVSATTTGSTSIATFSNRGNGIIDIAAPGVSIYSCYPTSLASSGYASMDGTSQAAPQVAAAAAYILSVNKNLASSKTKATVDTVTAILKNTATKGSYNDATNFGAGLLNVEAAVKMAAPSDTTALQAPTVTVGGQAVVAGQVIQDTDSITLSSALGTTANSDIKIYYTTNGKTPKETAANLYTGSFKLAASGSKTIKAMAVYYGNKSKVTTVKVKVNAFATDFTLESKTGVMSIASGKSLQLSATNITPSYTTDKKVTWKITEGGDFATISSKGKVSAKKNITKEQTVKVEASMKKAGGTLTKYATITILPVASKIALKNAADKTCKLTYPETKKMDVTVTPEGVNPPITYSSSNTKVAKVDAASGLITAVGSGKATITAKTADGSNKSVKMTVNVTKPVQEVTVTSKTGLKTVAAGKSLVFVADVTKDATNKKLDWKVEPLTSGTTLDGIKIKNGTLSTTTAVKKVTEVKVTATAQDGSGVSDYATATIYPSTTKKVALEGGSTYNLGTKAQGTLTTSVQLLPYTDGYTADFIGRQQGSGTQNLGNFTYKSSKTKVATVSSTGVVTAVAPGSAKITITANDGSKKKTTCTIKVVRPVTTLVLTPKSGVDYVGKGKTMSLVASMNTDATNKKLKWSSWDTSIATVDAKGKVKGKSYDEEAGYSQTVIIAEAQDGSGVYQSFLVTVLPTVEKVYLPTDFYCNWDSEYNGGESWFSSSAKTTMMRGQHYDLPTVYFKYAGKDNLKGIYDPYYAVNVSCSNPNVIQFNWYVDSDNNVYGVLSTVNKGTANITYKALDGSGKKATLKITVK